VTNASFLITEPSSFSEILFPSSRTPGLARSLPPTRARLALALLRDAFAQGHPFDIEIHRDIDIEPLRGYPPFEDLMKPKG
jgi:hypothetical protein